MFVWLSLVASVAAQSVYPTGTTIFEDGVCAGPTLMNPPDGGVVLLDMNGKEQHRWTLPGGRGAAAQISRPLPNGHVLTQDGRRDLVELDWDSQVVGRIVPTDSAKELRVRGQRTRRVGGTAPDRAGH